LCLLKTGYRPMAIPAAVAAQTNSMSAVNTTRLSFAANLAKSTGALTGVPNGTRLNMAAAEQAMNRTPTAIAFALYEGVSMSRASVLSELISAPVIAL